MKKHIFGIYGASGFGKEVLPLLKEQVGQDENIYFIDDNKSAEVSSLLGINILTFDQFLALNGKKYVSIAISNNKVRELLTVKCLAHNVNIFTIKAESSIILGDVKIGEGAILCPFTTLTSDIIIGKSFHANIYSYVAHDCIIGDYVTFAPAVKCNGNVYIENHVYVGTGAIIHQGKPNKPLTIGQGAVIAAGAVVTKSVPAGMTVFGNPAIEFTKENLKRRM